MSIMERHKERGCLRAHEQWILTFDREGHSKEHKLIKTDIRSVDHQIRKDRNFLDSCGLLDSFEERMESVEEKEKERVELKTSLAHKPLEVVFNEKALIVLTEIPIPLDVKIGLSFGRKFLFPYRGEDIEFFKILSQIDKTIDEAIPEMRVREASLEVSKILREKKSLQYDQNIRWLLFIKYRISRFLEEHPDILVTRSDKGGHTVIMENEDYDMKLKAHLDCDSYREIETDPLEDLVKMEAKIVETLGKNKKLERFMKKICFTPECLNLPSFYGLPKIHKQGSPLRPITPTINTPSHFTAKVFLRILKKVFPRTDFHIKDTFKFIEFIREIEIEPTDVLVSFDVVSMYTNIPFNLVYDIILKRKEVFWRDYGIDRQFLVTLLKFTLKECMFFTALDKIYRQMDGLPMGTCLSPLIARIVMDEVTYTLLKEVPEIKFIRIFVDDTIVAVRLDLIDKALETLNNFRPGQLKFTKEVEINESINFLNTTLIRKGNHIETDWYKKSFASGRLLNYFSSHKRSTILNTAVNFIETLILISDGNFFEKNKEIAYKVLRENSFPESLIMILMNEHFTLMRPIVRMSKLSQDSCAEPISQEPLGLLPTQLQILITEKEEEGSPFVIYPQAVCESRKIKRVIHMLKKKRKILTESTRNTKDNFITTRKTKIPMKRQGNLILISKCVCGKKICVTGTKHGECGASGIKRITTIRERCTETSHAYKKVKLIKGLFYSSQTGYLIKYIQWLCRKYLDAFYVKYEFPTPIFSRLVIDVDDPYKFLTKKKKKKEKNYTQQSTHS